MTTAALFSTLARWAEDFQDLEVYCDRSKPLEADADVLRALVNRKQRIRMGLGGRERLIVFNLTRPVALVESRDSPGIQLADVLASSYAYALNHFDDSEAWQWVHGAEGPAHG